MRFFKAITLKSIAILLIIFTVFAFSGGVIIHKVTYSAKKITVVIDAGHGGIDGGASGVNTNVRESDINLLIAKKLENLFSSSGFNTVMTRTGDYGLYGTTDPGFKMRDLVKRVEIINGSGAEIAISIHLNVYTASYRRGAQAFYKKGDEKAQRFAKNIQNRINGMRLSPRILSALSGDYYLLNQSKIPMVIVECGFLSNQEDEKLLLSEEYRTDMADAIFNGSLVTLLSHV